MTTSVVTQAPEAPVCSQEVAQAEAVVPPREKSSGSDETQVETGSPETTEFKEGGYGWVVTIAVLLINAHTWGLNSSYAVFLAYYLRSGTITGASPLAFAFVGGLSISTSMLVSPIVTWSIGKFGTSLTLRCGVVLEAVSFICASFSTHVWHLLLSQGLCFGIGLGFCFISTGGVVPQWFVKKRSFANAVATCGSGFGGLTYSLATNSMISNLGLAWAFRILAIVSFVVNGVCSILVKDRNKAVGAIVVPFHKGLLKNLDYWLYLGWGFFSLIAYVIVVFSLTDYSQSVGFTASQGSLAAAIFNLSQGLGRPLIGLASDRLGRINVGALGNLIAGLAAYFLWIFAGKYFGGLIVYALFGMFAGNIWPCVAPVGVEVVGLQLLPAGTVTQMHPPEIILEKWLALIFPAALSLYWLVLVLPSTFAEVIGLSLRTSGIYAYLNVQAFTGTMFVVSFLFLWVLRCRKIQQLDLLGLDRQKCEDAQANCGTEVQQPKNRWQWFGSHLHCIIAVKKV